MDFMSILGYIGWALASLVTFSIIKWLLSLRRVVPTNEVHIVQSSKATVSYGKDMVNVKGDLNGNTYYEWPSWIPLIGVTYTIFPTSVFDITLHSYPAYDKDRVPFLADIMSFFRIDDSNVAASRVASFEELKQQLTGIVQGAVRTIMAKAELSEIMSERAIYGKKFTEEVEEQLQSWGVIPVKNIELMDIRDDKGSEVIQNIMAKKKSHIEMESRTEVAKNHQAAQIAEIDAKRQVDLQNQEAEQQVGLRKATVAKQVGIAQEQAQQEVKEQARVTAEKDMAVKKVETVKLAEITKEALIIQAEQDKQIIVLKAEGDLAATTKEAEGITLEGNANAAAKAAMLLAPVTAELKLVEGIGSNKDYQEYMVRQKQVDANQAIGIEQAKNLGNADIKIIVNSGDVPSGVSNVMDIFSSKGGLAIGSALESLANTPLGKQLATKLVNSKEPNIPKE